MSNPIEEPNPEPGQTMISAILPIAGVLFIVAAIFAFFTMGWVAGLCILALAAVLFALGGILDLLQEIYRSLRRLETMTRQKEKDEKIVPWADAHQAGAGSGRQSESDRPSEG